MSLPGFESVAQVAVGRVLNTLPESLLVVLGAGLVLKLVGRRNSGTRFAIWMVALLAVTGLPFLGFGDSAGAGVLSHASFHPEITIPVFWAEAFLILWISGALFALARMIAGVLRIRSIRAHCSVVDLDALDPMLRDTMREHSVSRTVLLATSEQVRVPTAMGFSHPAVVFPSWVLRDLPPQQLRPILIHELAHLARRDDWTNLLQKVVRAVFCFHPAVWWIDARLSTERELACDDAVLIATADPRTYASSLLDLIEKSGLQRSWSMAQAAIGRAREATQRITRILQGGPTNSRTSPAAVGLAAMVSAASLSLLLVAPQIIGFSPEHSAAAVALQSGSANASRLLPRDEAAFASRPVEVVRAAWHPPARAVKKLHVRRTELRHGVQTAVSLVAGNAAAEKATSPDVRLVRAERGAQQPIPMLLVFEARSAGSAPPVAPLVAEGRTAAITGVETVQYVERLDGSGIHIQVLRIVLLAPAQSSEPQPGSISQSI